MGGVWHPPTRGLSKPLSEKSDLCSWLLLKWLIGSMNHSCNNKWARIHLGILSRTCFLPFCNMNGLEFSKSSNSNSFLFHNSFFNLFLFCHHLLWAARRNQGMSSTLCLEISAKYSSSSLFESYFSQNTTTIRLGSLPPCNKGHLSWSFLKGIPLTCISKLIRSLLITQLQSCFRKFRYLL